MFETAQQASQPQDSSWFHSQSQSQDMLNFGNVLSPLRKRGRSNTVVGTTGNNSVSCHDENSNINNSFNSSDMNIFQNNGNSNLSQDNSIIGSQFSQDMSDRIDMLSFRGLGGGDGSRSQDDSSISYLKRPGEDSTSAPFIPFSKHIKEAKERNRPSHENGDKSSSSSNVETERQITIPPPIVNPFFQPLIAEAPPTGVTNPHSLARQVSIQAGQSALGGNQQKKGVSIWIAPFKERPRYMSDFDQEGILGEGTFSSVFKARRRLDGCLYAVKKLKAKIVTERGGEEALKEVCALAALQGCPNLIRYFNCWLEDSYLWIQTELCLGHTLDVFVTGIVEQKHMVTYCPMSQDAYSSHSEFPMITPKYVDSSTMNFDDLEDDMDRTQSVECSQSTKDETEEKMPEKIAWMVLETVAEALGFMHKRGIAHLDIRPSNVFMSATDLASVAESKSPYTHVNSISSGLLSGDLSLKVGDLGLCCLLSDPIAANEGEQRYCAGELINGVDATLGPSISMAPQFGLRAAETARPSSSSSFFPSSEVKSLDLTKADIFSLGASVYELCKGNPLAGGGNTDENDVSEWHEIRAGCLDTHICSVYSNELISLLRKMMAVNPSDRPSASELVDICHRHEKNLIQAQNSDVTDVNNKLKFLLESLGVPVQQDVMSQIEDIVRSSVSGTL